MSTEHSHEHFPEGASCCSGSCGSGSCCCSGDAIGPVPAVLGIALFISALAAGGDSLAGMAAYVGSYLLIGWDVLKAAFLGMMRGRAINENFLMSIAGVHLGHQTRKWHPSMKKYLLKDKAGIHIINLEETEKCLDKACMGKRESG